MFGIHVLYQVCLARYFFFTLTCFCSLHFFHGAEDFYFNEVQLYLLFLSWILLLGFNRQTLLKE